MLFPGRWVVVSRLGLVVCSSVLGRCRGSKVLSILCLYACLSSRRLDGGFLGVLGRLGFTLGLVGGG